MQQDLMERIKKHVTLDRPLGPSNASKIKNDDEVAAKLFDPHNKSFNTLLRKDIPIVIGRRGSGKTALLNSFKYLPYLDPQDLKGNASRLNVLSYEIVIPIVAHNEFLQMQSIITKNPNAFKPIESVIEGWSELIKDRFLAHLLFEEGDNDTEPYLQIIFKYLNQESATNDDEMRKLIWGEPLFKSIKRLFVYSEPVSLESYLQEDAMDAAVTYLKKVNKRAIIIFDSLDEYDVGNKVFDRTVGALLRFISNFNDEYELIKMKLGLPSEIFPEIMRASANPLKDFVDIDEVQWSSIELQQIAAYRYQLFLELYDPLYWESLKEIDFSDRKQVIEFWARFFPNTHINRYGIEEDVLTYVMRHTQLLPRQFFVIMQEIIVSSARKTGDYRKFSSEVIMNSVERIESIIATEIFTAFEHVYSKAERVGRAVFGNFPTVFTYDELESQWRKKARSYQLHESTAGFEMVDFTEMLIRMGIIGIVTDQTPRYFEGQFAYNSLTPPNIGSGHQLCLHPIFSKCFNAKANSSKKAILPKGVQVDD